MEILGLAVAFLAGLVLREFLPGYLREKGKNATKQDIAEITKKVEEVRHEYGRSLENLRHEKTTERFEFHGAADRTLRFLKTFYQSPQGRLFVEGIIDRIREPQPVEAYGAEPTPPS